jgi:hypothetical protein
MIDMFIDCEVIVASLPVGQNKSDNTGRVSCSSGTEHCLHFALLEGICDFENIQQSV